VRSKHYDGRTESQNEFIREQPGLQKRVGGGVGVDTLRSGMVLGVEE
jgi:hypothetical protein